MFSSSNSLDCKDPVNTTTTPSLKSELSGYSPSLSSTTSEDFQEAVSMSATGSSTIPTLEVQELSSQQQTSASASQEMLALVDEFKHTEMGTVELQDAQMDISTGNGDANWVTADITHQVNVAVKQELDETLDGHSDRKASAEDMQLKPDSDLIAKQTPVEERYVAREVTEVAVVSMVDNSVDHSKVTSQIDVDTVDKKTETNSSSECQSGQTITPPETSSSATECSIGSDEILAQKINDMTLENAKAEAGTTARLASERSSGGPDPGRPQGLRDSRWRMSPDQIDSQVRQTNGFVPRPFPHQQHYNAYRDRDELRRLQPQLVKTEQDLRALRDENRMLRKKLEEQPHDKTNAGLLGLFQEVVNKQAEVQQEKSSMARMDLKLREKTANVERIELFLSEGQKQLKRRLEDQGLRTASELELEHARAEGQAATYQKLRDIDTRLADRQMKANLCEAELEFRQRHWKLEARDGLIAELRKTLRSEIHDEIAEVEYEQGFRAGKDAGLAENAEVAKHEGFLQGYEAARKAQDKLAALKQGKIAYDSADLDFLFDFSHPQNPFNLGRQLGSREPVSTTSLLHRPSFYSQITGDKSPECANSNGSTSPARSMDGLAHDNHINDSAPYASNSKNSRVHADGVNGYAPRNNGFGGSAPPHHAVDYSVQYPTEANNQRFTTDGHVVQANEPASREKTVPNLMDF
ncbi:hypothetical protein BDV96DRAFT_599948 [Lophiotrema nucula]|uniref:Uncharacterized protein n=1 Tax=Lophiotrema nucula TaxID=690887 RepID=A0A6A5Z5L0_9PLEO|nr:hypothetical protein BDV96DRAFT_599948 [Lophiotrema nucula]